MKFFLILTIIVISIMKCGAFFRSPNLRNVPTYTPKNIEEVKKYLCNKMDKGCCVDNAPAKIIINQLFDFTASEGKKEEMGCYHKTSPKVCLKNGQLKLNVGNQCDGLTPTKVSYNVAGKQGIDVGSNKIIIGEKGGGFKGKGLRLKKSENVEIRNLKITDINPQVIWGGDAIDLINVKNVLIDGNYFKNIGRQMIVTHFGKNSGLTISNNVFDGDTPYSSYCDNTHYWLWLFLGEGDMITMQNNVILNTSGRGPHLVSSQNSKAVLHMIQNSFYNVKHFGLIDLDDTRSSILLEGNVFVDVKEIVHKNTGNIFMPQNKADQDLCLGKLGRQCLLNTIVGSGGDKPKNSVQVLDDFGRLSKYLAKPINMKNSMTKLIKLPDKLAKNIR